MHPADEIRGIKSSILQNKKIVLGITGSIAAVECIKLSRELIRNGAKIIPVMTEAATKIIHPYSIEFATGNKPIIELTGQAEHVKYCGKVNNPADLMLISPCTANTISKIAHGIDDTTVTTFATTAIGSKIPIIIVPAMHLSMYDHKIIQKNIEKCKKIGIKFIYPFIDKNIAKMANLEEISSFIYRELGSKDMSKKKVLIIGGATAEPIDDVRFITNHSSGKTAIFLAKNAYFRNADVELWYGLGSEKVPSFINCKKFERNCDLIKMIKSEIVKKFDIIINCAAISDYSPKKTSGKIPSGKPKLQIELNPTKKVISLIRKNAPKSKIIAFKVEDNKKNVKNKSIELLEKNNLDYVIGNTISGFNSKTNEILIVDKKSITKRYKGKKDKLANIILNLIK